MNISVEDKGSCLKKISIEIPSNMIQTKVSENYRQLNRQVQLPGFRKGKAPKQVLEKKYGNYVLEDVRKELVDDALQEAIREHDIDLISQPEFEGELPEIEKDKTLAFSLTVEVRPEFELPTYKGLEIELKEPSVNEEEVDAFVRNVQFSQGQLHELKADEKSQKGDLLFARFVLFVDDEEVASRDQANLEIGTKTILGISIPEAEEAFLGLEAQEKSEKSFEVTLPDDFPKQAYAGKKATLKIHVQEIRRPELPELDEALLKKLDFESLEDLREHARDVILQEKHHQQEQDIENQLLERVVSEVKLEIPEKMAERQLSTVLQREAFRKYQEGLDDKAIEEFIEKRRQELPATIESKIRMDFVIDAIAKKERIFVVEDELSRHIAMLAQMRNVSPEELFTQLEKNHMLPQIRWELKASKTKTLLRQKAKLLKPEAEQAAKESTESEKSDT